MYKKQKISQVLKKNENKIRKALISKKFQDVLEILGKRRKGIKNQKGNF